MNWRIKFGYSIFTSIFLKLNNAPKSKQYNPKMARQYHHTFLKKILKSCFPAPTLEKNSFCKAISHCYKKSNFYSHPVHFWPFDRLPNSFTYNCVKKVSQLSINNINNVHLTTRSHNFKYVLNSSIKLGDSPPSILFSSVQLLSRVRLFTTLYS